jgi:hypothetical protein
MMLQEQLMAVKSGYLMAYARDFALLQALYFVSTFWLHNWWSAAAQPWLQQKQPTLVKQQCSSSSNGDVSAATLARHRNRCLVGFILVSTWGGATAS